MQKTKKPHRFVCGVLAATSILIVVLAISLGERLGIQPCYLCNFQRFLYMSLAVVSLVGCVLPKGHAFFTALAALVAGGGVVTAGYQSWMQFAPELATECGFGDPTLPERIVNWLAGIWPSVFMVTGFCSAKDNVIAGLSLANLSAAAFLALMLFALWSLVRRFRQ